MGSKDTYYSYDVETGQIVSKTRFNDNGTVDRWEGIQKKGYSHDVYSGSTEFAAQEKGSVFSRPRMKNPNKTWQDRDGVFADPSSESRNKAIPNSNHQPEHNAAQKAIQAKGSTYNSKGNVSGKGSGNTNAAAAGTNGTSATNAAQSPGGKSAPTMHGKG